jgi:hypothetical protein
MTGTHFSAEIRDGLLHMRGERWSMSCPQADLPKWLALYTSLRDRGGKSGHPGPFARFYMEPVQVLTHLARKQAAA